MKFRISCLAVSLLIIGCVIISLSAGIIETSWSDLAAVLLGKDCGINGTVIRQIRLPRILSALIAGGALGVAGVILQTVLHNDLASPEIIGVSSGAGLAGILLIFFLPQYSNFLGAAAFAGALLVSGMIYSASWKKGLSPVRLILAGVAITTLCGALSAGVLLFNAERIAGAFDFMLGGFAGRSLLEVLIMLPCFAIMLFFAFLQHKKLEILSLDDESAAALGINVNFCRLAALVTAALAASVAVSLAGLLGFVGLMAPHTARKFCSSNIGEQMLLSALFGSFLAALGEVLGKTVLPPRELPAGLFLSIAGAVFFMFLLLKERTE